MSPVATIAVYSMLVVGASLLGGWLPSIVRLTHTRVQLLMSGVGGLMLGIGLFHLLPHAVGPQVSLDRAMLWMMFGLLTTFLMIRAFHAHQHAPVEVANDPHETEHDHHPHHHDDHVCVHEPARPAAHPYSWIGIALGLAMHTLLDGVALAASVMHDAFEAPGMMFYGLATFLGVALHKPLDSLSIASMMAASGWSERARQWVNFSYAVMCPACAALLLLGVQVSGDSDAFLGCSLAFAAGIFLCIALGDLLPELHFHAHDRFRLTAALLLGVALAWGMRYLEPGHVHEHSSQPGLHGHVH